MLQAGETVGRYRIDGVLGRGASAVVYLATQELLGRRVALKVLARSMSGAEAAAFEREARMQAGLDHPHIVDVYEAAIDEHGAWLAMRYVEGTTLRSLIRGRELSPGRALGLLEQIASALDHMHAADRVHRDLKPQNVLVGRGDHAWLADFGLARDSDAGAGVPDGFGTVGYVSPEVILGNEATAASDRYAFAAILYECLAGAQPFPRPSEPAVLFAHVNDPVPSLHEQCPALPAALDPILASALAKDPGARPSSATELVAAARAALDGSAPSSIARRRGRRIPPRAIAGAAAASAAGLAAALLLSGPGSSGTPAAIAGAPPAGAIALGSSLEAADVESVDCMGAAPGASSPACTISQVRLRGRSVVAPADGAIVAWWVRGASGDLRIQVLRGRGSKTREAWSSKPIKVSGRGLQRLPAGVAVRAGDRIAVQLAPGAVIGIRRGVPGTAVDRWIGPALARPRAATSPAGTGFDHELQVRFDVVPGARLEGSLRVTGRAAARAPGGRTLELREADLPGLGLVEVRAVDRLGVQLDLFRGSHRLARIDVAGTTPGGKVTGLHLRREGRLAHVTLEWEGGPGYVRHEYLAGPRGFEQVS